jgi:phosphoribosylamine---glycine ligase
MNILLLGSGGREHAFARSLSKSSLCPKLFIAPGNPGTASCGVNVNMGVNDFPAIKEFVLQENISLVIVGPEDPLVNGIVDYFLADAELKNIPVIGPSKAGAQLEGSKAFSKAFMQRHGIPTAAYRSFNASHLKEAYTFLEELTAPYVLKADGLAAGKGVIISDDLDEAKAEVKAMLSDKKFGKASEQVVIEAFLKGIEVSVFVLTDGKSYKILPEAKDYKRIGDGDTGLNTGGMGAVSPVPFVDAAFIKKVETLIVKPTIEGLRRENIPYKGFIFLGLMNDGGEPSVIEYNCRMGDPETEAVLPRIKTDLLQLMLAVAEEKLDTIELDIDPRTAATVVMVSGGYPGNFEKGYSISGIEKAGDTLVFHSGTTVNENKLQTNGGRVFALTSLADTLEEALEKSYHAAKVIHYDYQYYRKDIGKDVLKLMSVTHNR